jgi:glutamate-1-semialdehyde 2,1-aminomutase
MKVVAIVQARMGSTRLPGKVMRSIGNMPMIALLLSRLSRSKGLDQIVVATSIDSNDTPLVDHVERLGYLCIRGS